MLEKLKINLFQVDQVIGTEHKMEGILHPILHLSVLMLLLFLNEENTTHIPSFFRIKTCLPYC